MSNIAKTEVLTNDRIIRTVMVDYDTMDTVILPKGKYHTIHCDGTIYKVTRDVEIKHITSKDGVYIYYRLDDSFPWCVYDVIVMMLLYKRAIEVYKDVTDLTSPPSPPVEPEPPKTQTLGVFP